MNKILRYSLIMLLAMVNCMAWAQTASYSLTFPDENKENVSSYTQTWEAKIGDMTWSIANFNNNQWKNNWTYIKCGSKNNASVATITNSKAMSQAIASVVVTIDKVTASNVNSIKLEISTADDFSSVSETVNAASIANGDMKFKIAAPQANAYYRITFDCQKGSSNGLVQVSKVEYFNQGNTSSKTDAGLQWSETQISLKKGTELTPPTFTKATTAEVTFTSNNEDVATVNSEGVISLGTQAGTAKITATSAENDTYAAGTATCTIEVYNVNVYKKVTTIESGKKYLIVAQRDGKTYYAIPHSADKNYGYLSTSYATGTLDKLEINQKYDDTFVFTTEGSGYSIKDNKTGRYYVQKEDYKSFNLSETAAAWSVEPQADGTFKIEQNGYYMQFGEGTYTSFGVYTEAQANTAMPMLYVYDEGTSTGIGSVNAAASNANAPIYNLAGQRVGNDYKGVVIQNGKKRINK